MFGYLDPWGCQRTAWGCERTAPKFFEEKLASSISSTHFARRVLIIDKRTLQPDVGSSRESS